MASKAFSLTLAESRRSWANGFVHLQSTKNLWEAAKWRHGRRLTRIPPLRDPSSGEFVFRTDKIAPVLSSRFFPTSPPTVSPSQPDDPDPLPRRDWPPITSDEIQGALASTTNSSTPGPSGINYKLLKWAFEAQPGRFVDLYNACLEHGVHPWTSATVIPVPKPHKPDYSIPKAYRPISLLECCGKLLEKIIAAQVLHDLNTFSILPPNQFGSRDNHSAVDAAMSLVHTAQQGLASGHPVVVILFDIQGFFDNIQKDRTVHLFDILGFPDSVIQWIQAFLSGRSVSLHFNGWTGDLIDVSDGTAQGSPLSPVISAVYTLPLLHRARLWTTGSLQIFVDDGAIAASCATHRSAIERAGRLFEDVTDWFARCGLRTDPEKTEFITFYNPRRSANLIGSPPSHIALRNAVNGEITVPRSTCVRYLGIYLHYKLNWTTHVRTMANRARSTIRALHILGNSVRGLDYANWRLAFNAIILPVLTYGAPIWASGNCPKYLTNIAQVAQNDALRRIAGCFHTTPVDPLHHLLAILPIRFTLSKLCNSYLDRLAHLPPTHLLRTLPYHNPAACWPKFQQQSIPTALRRLLPATFPVYYPPSSPSEQTWAHPRVRPPPRFEAHN